MFFQKEEVLNSPELSVLPTFLHGEKSKAGTKGSPLEKQVLDLQRQVGVLSAQSRSLHSPTQDRFVSNPDEARYLINSYLSRGMPRDMIVRRVAERGVPLDWATSELKEIIGKRRAGRARLS